MKISLPINMKMPTFDGIFILAEHEKGFITSGPGVLETWLQIRGGIHIIFFLFLHKNIHCGYSLEAPRRGASNEYPQHMFSWSNKKDISIFE